jgi:2-polyprenyl-3-methyl-5-hydroxy-6-metoxy-1,4-benzoquinol methylase
MDRAVYDRMAELDATHWWFTARRRILQEIVARVVRPPKHARILELGAGTGHNLAMLSRFGNVEGSELDDHARGIAEKRVGRPLAKAMLPDLGQFEPGAYDLVALLDVLEHVEGDRAALDAIMSLLKPGGALLVTVPANKWMWSAHDVAHHHHRRYTRSELRALFKSAGFDIELLSFFNSLLFPPIALARLMGKLRKSDHADDAMPGAAVNRLLDSLFGLEARLIGRIPLPFGVSLIAVLRRPRG